MKVIILILFQLFISDFIFSANIIVNSISSLQSALDGSASGDTIMLANGIYLNNTINIDRNNITLRAGTPGGVSLNGTNSITINGDNVTFSGFQFTSGGIPGIVITVNGNRVNLTDLNFNGYSAQKYINLKGQYDIVAFSNFENKPVSAPQGNLIHIYTREDGSPNYATIKYCSFQNMPGAGGDNGNECIRITNATPSTYKSGTIIEFCYFSNTGYGDSEAISVKSEENIIRFNTMLNNLHSNFCFRFGDNNVAYSNYFINSGGIRIKQANYIYCYNNYFENCGDGDITAPVKYVFVAGALSNINFTHNTFIGGTSIELDSGATSNTWANNIFKNTSGEIFSGSVSGVNFSGNIYSGNSGMPLLPGLKSVDPQLFLNTDGYYELASSSPAIDNSDASYPSILNIPVLDDDPNILNDIECQSRNVNLTLKDVGCNEFSDDVKVNKPLSLHKVGPSYLRNNSTSLSNDNIEYNDCIIYPVPCNNNLQVKLKDKIVDIDLYDMKGEKIHAFSNINQEFYILNLQGIVKGFYFLRITDGKSNVLSKKIKIE